MFLGINFEKVFKDLMAMLAQDRFRMELHAFDRQCLMFYPHNFFHRAIGFIGPAGHFQTFRQGGLINHQGMIAHGRKRVGQASEHALAVMVDGGSFAVHHVTGADDMTAEGLADALMTQADAENRDPAGEGVDDRQRHAGRLSAQLVRRHRPAAAAHGSRSS